MTCEPPLWLSTGVFVLVGLFFLSIVIMELPWGIRRMLEEWDYLTAFLRHRGE